MITISTLAKKHFIALLLKEPVDTHIRFFITNPGTSYAECGLSYCLKNEVEKSDISFSYDHFFVYVNELIIPYLKNSEIDLIVDNLGSQLTLKAPYSTKNLFYKQSLLENEVEIFLNSEINPKLLMHRGRIDLIKITSDGIAMISFSGGCNGCSMIEQTLKNMIEKTLLSKFPKLKKIRDKTVHLHGNHSFF